MANERGHPKLSYEVLKAEFHPQVAEKIGNYVSKGPAPRMCCHVLQARVERISLEYKMSFINDDCNLLNFSPSPLSPFSTLIHPDIVRFSGNPPSSADIIYEWHLSNQTTASLSHLRTMLPKSSSCPKPAQRPNHAI